MHPATLIVTLGLAFLPSTYAINGKTYTTWDCCKPACAWKTNLGNNVQGSPRVCDINNNILADGLNAGSSCQSGGKGFLCDDYVPVPVSDKLSYGFAAMPGDGKCCKCYQLNWTSGNAAGKSMIVQAINIGGVSGAVQADDIIILTPGGGVGPNDSGCRNQYGTSWGNDNGGVDNSASCANLPQNLQGGCYWRYNWARGSVNGWNINYQQVSCPSQLTSISGCVAY